MRLLHWLHDLPLRVELWLCDRIAGPLPETEADRIREREEAAKVVRFPIGGAATADPPGHE